MAHAFDVISPVELTAFVRELDPTLYGFTLTEYLPSRTVEDVEYAFTQMDRRREDVAPYRGFDTEAAIGSRPGFSRVRGELPPISKKLALGEEQRLRLDQFRGSDAGGRVADAIFNDASLNTESVLGRVELALGEALTTGKVTFTSDPGIDADVVVDYLRGNTLPAGSALTNGNWTTPGTATPITDIMQWNRDYRARNNGQRPAAFITHEQNIDAAMLCDEVTSALYPVVGQGVQFPDVADLNRFLGSRRVPPLVPYDTIVSVAGSNTDVIADDQVFALPAPSPQNFGETLWGLTAEAMDAVEAGFDTLATAPGLYAITDRTFDPIQTWTKVSGIVLPVIKDWKLLQASPTVR